MCKALILVAAALALTGCAQGTFTTRGAVTLDGTKVLLCSQWGALPCVATEMDPRDAWAIIEALKARAALDALAGGPPKSTPPKSLPDT